MGLQAVTGERPLHTRAQHFRFKAVGRCFCPVCKENGGWQTEQKVGSVGFGPVETWRFPGKGQA